MSNKHHDKLRFSLAILLPFCALTAQWLLWPWLKPFAWFLFFPTVFFSARLAGLWAGLISTFISAVLVWLFFITPQLNENSDITPKLYCLGLFLLMGYLFSDSHERLRRLREQQQDFIAAALEARQQAEQAIHLLEKSEQRLLMAQEAAQVGIWEWDRENHESYLSPEYNKLFGFDANDNLNNNHDWRALVLAEDLPAMDAIWQSHISQGKAFEVEFRARLKSGEIRWFISRGRAIYDAEAKPIRIFGINLDITARKNTEQQLRKLAQAVEQSPESIIITNLKAEIEYANPVYLQVTGYSLDELIGKNQRILQSGKTPSSTYLAFWQAMHNGQNWKGEFINRRKDGEEYTVLAIVNPLRQADGHISHYVSVQEDITEKKRIAHELDQYRYHLETLVQSRTAELETAKAASELANQAKSTFLANMSHEIRTPINAIIGLSHLLKQSQLNQKQQERLGKIDTASQHLLSIINDILDLSKIEAGQLELEQADFALDTLLEQVYNLISTQAKAKGLTLAIESDTVPLWLHGDLTRLRQALLNYASNAIKFTASGCIGLRARLLAETEQGLLIRFEIQDSGIGIEHDKLSKFFESFVQGDVSTTRMYGGTGLGLSITRHLATMMGGTVGVESSLGQGSVFWFTVVLQHGQGVMPTATSPVEKTDSEVEIRSHYTGASVLLVDDNAINREVALELLHGVGLAVDTAENGLIAVEKASKYHYDLILMDMQMPKMDGLEATQRIRMHPDCTHLPILALTANAFAEDRSQCIAAGMNDFIAKPVNPVTLYDTILHWLASSKQDKTLAILTQQAKVNLTLYKQTFLEAKLNTLPGINIKQGFSIVKGDANKYQRLLLMFIDHNRNDMITIIEKLNLGDRLAAKNIAHSFKGVAGTLGANNLFLMAKNLENSLTQDVSSEACIALAQQCQQALVVLIEASKLIVDHIESENSYPTQLVVKPTLMLRNEEIISQFNQLLTALSINEPCACEQIVTTLESQLGTETMTAIKQNIQQFNFRGAEVLVKTLRDSIA